MMAVRSQNGINDQFGFSLESVMNKHRILLTVSIVGLSLTAIVQSLVNVAPLWKIKWHASCTVGAEIRDFRDPNHDPYSKIKCTWDDAELLGRCFNIKRLLPVKIDRPVNCIFVTLRSPTGYRDNYYLFELFNISGNVWYSPQYGIMELDDEFSRVVLLTIKHRKNEDN